MQNVTSLGSVQHPVVNFKAGNQQNPYYNPNAGLPQDTLTLHKQQQAQAQREQDKDRKLNRWFMGTIMVSAAVSALAIVIPKLRAKAASTVKKGAQDVVKNRWNITQEERNLGVKTREELMTLFKDVKNDGTIKSFDDLKMSPELRKSLDDIVDKIRDAKTYDEFCQEINNAVLFYGPPGTGKTTFVNALCKKLGVNPFIYDIGYMKGGYTGVLEKNMNGARDVFLEEHRARMAKDPNTIDIIIFDECDEIFQKSNDDHANVLLTRFKRDLDTLKKEKGVYVIGMTNKLPGELNEAIDSRFLKKFIPAQKWDALEDIFFNHYEKGTDKVGKSLKERSDVSQEFFEILQARDGRHFAIRELENVGWKDGTIKDKDKPLQISDIIQRAIDYKDLNLSAEEIERLQRLKLKKPTYRAAA